MSAFNKYLFFLIAISFFSLILISDKNLLFGILLGVLLVVLSFVDFLTFKIPNWLNGLILLGGISYNVYCYENFWFPIISFLIAGISFYVLSAIYAKLRKRQGMGGGDIKFFACGAVWILPYYLPLVLMISSISALIYASLISLNARDAEQKIIKIPFGPFLSLGIWFSFHFGENIFNYFVI